MPRPTQGGAPNSTGLSRRFNHVSQTRYLTLHASKQTQLFVAPPGDASSIGRAPGFYPEGSGFDSLASHVCRATSRDLGSVA